MKFNMKKTYMMAAAALAAVAFLALPSCGSKDKETAADSSAVAVEETAGAVKESVKASPYTQVFLSEANKAEVSDTAHYVQTPSGLRYIMLAEGTGKQPTATSSVTVHYTGNLVDGTIFDSSVQRGEPATFPLNAVIPGWTEGVQLMKEGGKAVFYIPYNLAYGEQGFPDSPIGPKTDLVFEIELLKVD